MRKEYTIPIKMEIESENPDLDAKRIADSIYDAAEKYGLEIFHGEHLDMGYSIYIKADKREFSQLGGYSLK